VKKLKFVTGTCRFVTFTDGAFSPLARVYVRTSPHPLEPDYSPPRTLALRRRIGER